MPEASETVETIKTATSSDGTVKIAVEKYNELVETIANQRSSIGGLNEQLTRLRNEPPVINRTVINKTSQMLAQEHRAWGGTLMGLGASAFVVGAFRFRASSNT